MLNTISRKVQIKKKKIIGIIKEKSKMHKLDKQ